MCTYDLEKNAKNGTPVGTVASSHNLSDEMDIADREELDQVSWGEVAKGCFCHSLMGWAKIFFDLFWIAFFLYFFILGLEVLGDGAQVRIQQMQDT
jgi:sodium-dependent phosphate cotransporter